MNDAEQDQPSASQRTGTANPRLPIGFLALGLFWGFSTGYFLADSAAKAVGYQWFNIPYQAYYQYTLKCLLIGPAVGLFVGIFVDMLVTDPGLRKRLVEFGLVALVLVLFVYFALIDPGQQSVRE